MNDFETLKSEYDKRCIEIIYLKEAARKSADEAASALPKSKDWLVLRERAYMVRAEIKKRARRLGVPCPEIGDVPHKCESKAPSPRPCPSPRSRPAAPPMSALR